MVNSVNLVRMENEVSNCVLCHVSARIIFSRMNKIYDQSMIIEALFPDHPDLVDRTKMQPGVTKRIHIVIAVSCLVPNFLLSTLFLL